MAEMSPIEKWFVNRANPWTYQRVLRPLFQRHLRLPEAAVLLELGCGTGQAALIASELYRPAKFVVTDYDPSQVERARATFAGAYGRCPDNVAFETADALKLRYDDASFDAVFAFFVLHHLSGHKLGKAQGALTQGLAEIDRVLKPGGSFVYAELFQRKAICDDLARRGYAIIHRQTFLALTEQVVIRKRAWAATGTVGLSATGEFPAATG